MEPNSHVTPTPRYAAVVPADYNRGEKRLVPAAPKETPVKTPPVPRLACGTRDVSSKLRQPLRERLDGPAHVSPP